MAITRTILPIPTNGWRAGGNERPDIREFHEASSQSFVYGDLVYLSSNKVTVCGADPAAILGIALKAATGTADSIIPVWVIHGSDEFLMNVYHATAASATFSDQSAIDTAYEINKYAAGKWTIDIAATSSTRVTVINYEADSELGNLYMRCWVRFLVANLTFPY